MPNDIFYRSKYVCIRDVDLMFILDKSLEVIKDLVASEPSNQWLLDIREKWKRALINQGHNSRLLRLDELITDEISQKRTVQILNQTKQNILCYGEAVPSRDKRKRLLATDYYDVDGFSTQRLADIIDSIITLIED